MGLEERLLSFLWTVAKRSFSCVLFSLTAFKIWEWQMVAGPPKPKRPRRCKTGRLPVAAFIPQSCVTEIAPGHCFQALLLNLERPSRSLFQVDKDTQCTGDQRVVRSTFIESHNSHIHINQKSANWTSEADLQAVSVLINLGFTFYPRAMQRKENRKQPPQVAPKTNNTYTVAQSRKCRWSQKQYFVISSTIRLKRKRNICSLWWLTTSKVWFRDESPFSFGICTS